MSRDFTTKPRPDQPGRCPSIDPHDTLQCTRAIHDDDQCSAGGIAWRKGSPRIEWDRERADRLQKDVEEYDAILTRQSDLLTRTVNALRGNPPPLTSWSHHDIPELAAEKVAEVALLIAERDALAAQVARVQEVLDHWRTVDEGNAAYAERIGERSRFADGLASRADMLRAALVGSEADTCDVDVCSGDADCTSELHVHGCFADSTGPCTDPDEHQPTDQEVSDE